MRTIELLSPAKNADIGIEAIRHGADAVYIGGPGFGARAAAGNSVEDIARLCKYAHTFDAKVYVTINTILYDDEIESVQRLVHQLYDAGVDALITQDLALLSMDLPPIALHASTQMDNCTPERAHFLEAAGYSQIVLARELSLEQIRAIYKATNLPLEAFVHGALCVSYSGRCYASEHCFGRSANRGRCAQFCRLAFDLIDGDGNVIVLDKHLLSLRDMNRSASIEEMLEAGVSSFKIEGRLKDAAYVKNVTAYYRQAIDAVIERNRDKYCRASRGEVKLKFQPQLDKSFNRGFTEYFLHGRTNDVWNFNTPKSMGEHIGAVTRVTRNSLIVRTDAALSNGDGFVFLDGEEKLQGFRANRVEKTQKPGEYELFPFKMPAIYVGTTLYRNESVEWENMLAKPTAERRIPITFVLKECEEGYQLLGRAVGYNVEVTRTMEKMVAEKPQRDNIIRTLSKLGDTPFYLEDIGLELKGERFIPASQLADMRRQVTSQLEEFQLEKRMECREYRLPSQAISLDGKLFTYMANVSNSVSRKWLIAHDASDIQPAYEVKRPASPAVLMTCRHCIRYALGLCLQHKNQDGQTVAPAAIPPQGLKEPLQLRLPDGRTFTLRFDCKRCEMSVLA